MREALFGLELLWHDAVSAADTEHAGAIRIAAAQVPQALERPVRARGLWQVSDEGALFCMPRLLRLRVVGGQRVDHQREAGAGDDDLRAFVLGAALPMLLQQRGLRVLRGTAVSLDGQALVLIGPSSGGKSTVGAALLQQGARLVSDGWVVVDVDADGRAWVRPGLPVLRMFGDALDALGWSAKAVVPTRRACGGFQVAVSSVVERAVPVRAFAVLDAVRGRGEVTRQHGLQRVATLSSESPLLDLQPRSHIAAVMRDMGRVVERVPLLGIQRGDLTVLETARRLSEASGR